MKVKVFSATMAGIKKALETKQRSNPVVKLPEEYHKYMDVFDYNKADLLPSLRG